MNRSSCCFVRIAFLGLTACAVLCVGSAAFAVELPYSTDLRLWLKADAGVTADGSNRVSAWDDQLFGDNAVAENSAQVTAANQPLLVPDALNGMPVLQFDTTDFLRGPTSLILSSGTAARTVFVVANLTGANGDKGMFNINQGPGGGPYVYKLTPEFAMRQGAGNRFWNTTADATHAVFAVQTPDVPNNNTDNTLGYKNSATPLSVASTANGTNPIDTGAAGIQGYQVSQSRDGDVAEVLVYEGFLSGAEIEQVGYYLQQKYGVAGSFNGASQVFFDGLDTTDNNWQRLANWDTAAEPTATQDAYIGNSLTAVVTQTGEVAQNVFVGHAEATLPGTATLNITGGSLDTADLNLGNGGNTGNVTQTAGTVTLTGDLNFGKTGSKGGTYKLRGGTLNVGGIIKERISGVDGAQLLIDGGTLNVTGDITVQRFAIGDDAGFTGSYEIATGQTVTATGTTAPGGHGTGTLTLNGGTLNSGNTRIAQYSDGEGTVIVKGGSTWTTGYLYVGDTGKGTLLLEEGTVDNNSGGVLIAQDGSGSQGDVVVGTTGGSLTGAQLFTRGANLEVGTDGTGTLIQHSGTVTVETNNLIVGQTATADGTYTINDGKLETLTGQIRVGNTGLGVFNQEGGEVISANVLDLGNADNTASDGTYNLRGGSLTVNNTMVVGNLGKGVFNFEGGTMTFGKTLYVGGNTSGANSNGELNLGTALGPTVSLTTAQFEVGRYGVGVVNHVNADVTVASANLVIGQIAGSNGTYNMQGGSLDVGNFSGAKNQDLNMNSGTALFDQTGGDVRIERDLRLGTQNLTTSSSTYNLDGGSLSVGQHIYVGQLAQGEFDYNSGTFSIDGTLYVGGTSSSSAGAAPNASGTVNIGADGGTPTMDVQQFEVGRHNVGVANQYGGTVTVNGANNLVISQYAGSNGTYNMMDGQLTITAPPSTNGDINFNAGTGTLTQTGGTITLNGGDLNLSSASTGTATVNLDAGTMIVGGNLDYRNNGTDTVNLQGGTLDLTGGNIHVANRSGSNTFNFTDGTLLGVNQFNGTLTQDGGTLAPGNSPGLMTITGDYEQNGGTLEIEIEGTTPGSGYDQLEVGGNVSLAGDLSVLVSGYSTTPNDLFWIINNTGSSTTTGMFNGMPEGESIVLDGRNFYIYYGANLDTWQFTGGNDVLLTSVPEPSTLVALLGLAATGLLIYRRRRRG